MCEFISLCYTFLVLELLLTLFLWNLQKDIWQSIEAYSEKGNILRLKLESSLLRNRFEMCEFISQSYTVLFIKQFATSVFIESGIGYVRAD